MEWVLIIFLSGASAVGGFTQEFNDEASCTKALEKAAKSTRVELGFCTPKGRLGWMTSD